MFIVTLLLLATVGLGLVAVIARRVPEGEAWLVHRRGRYARVLRPGWHVIWPGIERVVNHVSLINHRVDLPLRRTPDHNVTAQRATVYFQIVEPERSGAQLADLDHLVEDAAREQAGALSAAGRDLDSLTERLKPLLNLQLNGLGLRVIRCQLPGA